MNYQEWIEENIPQDPEAQLGKCMEFCEIVRKQFPELKIVKGVVRSEHNADNYGGILKEYPHAWLEAPDGEIVDPAQGQFCLIEPIERVRFPENATKMQRCLICGGYFTDVHDGCRHGCSADLRDL